MRKAEHPTTATIKRGIYPPAITQPIQTSSKTSPVQLLETAIAVRRKSQTELSDLDKLLAEKSARHAALKTTGDLHDPAVLAELSRLQIVTELLPHRIAARKQDDAKAEQALTEATNRFIREHLGPRVRRLAAQTRATVEAELSLHFKDPTALIVGVAQSERVRGIEALSGTITVTPARGAVAHAQAALQSWTAANNF
jgi:hypothetical protein